MADRSDNERREPADLPAWEGIGPWSLAPVGDADPDEVAAVLSLAFHGSTALQVAWRDEILRDLRLGLLLPRHSVVALVGDAVVGVLLVAPAGADGARITAGGVAPAYQGRGVAGSMTGRVIERAREAGWRAVWLEVGGENHGAIRLWRRLGFEVVRRLLDLRAGQAGFHPGVASRPAGLVRPVAVTALLGDFDRLHAVAPCRSRRAERLARMAESLRGLELSEGGRRVAYLIHRGPRIEDLGVEPGREDAVGRLLQTAFGDETVLHVTTWPEEDPLTILLQGWGFVCLAASLEMRLVLPVAALP